MVIVAVVVLGSVWILFSRTISGSGSANNDNVILEAAPVAGHPAPNFELQNLDGQVISLTEFRGKPVVLNFWATWCGPCRAEMPEFQEVATDNADDLVIIGVNNTTSDTAELVDDFVEELDITFIILLDEAGETTETYRVLGLPTTIFIDRDGVVNEVFTGPINKAYIESKIPEL
jgi:peroxiredoxin